MKLQHMTVIFIIIVLPITLVLSYYIQAQIDIVTLRQSYTANLINATHDAMLAYELNTMNNEYSDVADSKKRDVQASINTFFNSFVNQFNTSGYKKEDIEPYIPAIIFTCYDGYYIYSPMDSYERYTYEENPNLEGEVKSDNKKTEYTLKPYVYYSARYKHGSNTDVVINYSLDNYISIYGELNGNYISEAGYVMTNNLGVDDDNSGSYSETVFTEESYLQEGSLYWDNDLQLYIYLNKDSGNDYYKISGFSGGTKPNTQVQKKIVKTNTSYRFYNIDGTIRKVYDSEFDNDVKFYLSGSNTRTYIKTYSSTYRIINSNYPLNADYDIPTGTAERNRFEATKKELIEVKPNDYNAVANKINQNTLSSLKAIQASDIMINGTNVSSVDDNSPYAVFKNDNTKIFDDTIENIDSNFNEHRKKVIKASIEQNMQLALNSYAQNNTSLKLPKLTEEDWDKILNNITMFTFMQGMPLKNTVYNDYVIATSNANKDYIPENGLYFIDNTNTYHKINCKTLANNIKNRTTDPNSLMGYSAVEFERHYIRPDTSTQQTNYYKHEGVFACYDCIVTSNTPELYVGNELNIDSTIGASAVNTLKQKYYNALAMARLTQNRATKYLEN